jgi:hypothetical protein
MGISFLAVLAKGLVILALDLQHKTIYHRDTASQRSPKAIHFMPAL